MRLSVDGRFLLKDLATISQISELLLKKLEVKKDGTPIESMFLVNVGKAKDAMEQALRLLE